MLMPVFLRLLPVSSSANLRAGLRFAGVKALAVSAFLALLAGLVTPASARAQTAHFSGVQGTIGSGMGSPYGIAVDGSGDVYVNDYNNQRVLEETLSQGGYTQSVALDYASSGIVAPFGIAVDASSNLYITDEYNGASGTGEVFKETLSAGAYTQSVVASGLYQPNGVAVDGSGNVYIADSHNSRVLKETPSAGSYTQSVVASGLSYPSGVAVDGSGNVYITDSQSNELLKETLAAGSYTRSVLLSTGLNAPSAVAVDGRGNIYIANTSDQDMLKESLVAGSYTLSTVPATGLNQPSGVAVDAVGDIFIADSSNNRVAELAQFLGNFGPVNVESTSSAPIPAIFTFDTAGTLGSISVVTQGATGLDFSNAGTGSCATGTAYTAGETCTVDVTFKPLFAGARYGAAVLHNNSGKAITAGYVQGTGVGPQVAYAPGTSTVLFQSANHFKFWVTGVAVDGAGDVFFADSQNSRVWELPAGGGAIKSFAAVTYPVAMTEDGAGNLFVADDGNNCVDEIPPGGGSATVIEPTVSGLRLNSPSGIAVDGAGDLFIADPGNNRVVEVPAGGRTPTAFEPTVDALKVSDPGSMAADGAGDLFIGDPDNNRVVEAPADGGAATAIEPIVDGVRLNGIGGLAADGVGDLFITNGATVVEVPAGGEAPAVTANDPQVGDIAGFAIDAGGDLFLTGNTNCYLSSCNDHIVEIQRSQPPALSFAGTPAGFTSSDSPQTVQLQNIGNIPLTLPIPNTGNNPGITADFTLDISVDSACPLVTGGSPTAATLDPGTSCLLPISFTPPDAAALGAETGSLTLTDNALNAAAPGYATQTIQLSGKVVAPVQATITSPTPGSLLTGLSATFTWTTGLGVTEYELSVGTTRAGSSNLYNGSPTTSTQASVTGFPVNGATVYARLSSLIYGVWQHTDYTYTALTAATLTTPVPGSTLAAPSVTFSWTSTADASINSGRYQLLLGTTGVGSSDLYNSGLLNSTSVLVTGLPTKGQTIYARLASQVDNGILGGIWLTVDYTYAEAVPTPATLTPSSGTLSTSQTFTWSNGVGPTAYRFLLGTTGAGSNNLYGSGITRATSATVTLPADGVTVFAILYQEISGVWQYTDYTYTESGTPVLATLSPSSGTLSTSQTFTWNNGVGPSAYRFMLGTTGAGSSNLYGSGVTTATSATVTLPTDGITVYATLYQEINGVWQSTDYTFTEPGTLPAMQSPTPGTTTILGTSNVTFTWTPGTGVTLYDFWLGTKGLGSDNVYVAGHITTTSATAPKVPYGLATDTLYVRLWYLINGIWHSVDYTYSATPSVAPALTTPTPGTVLGTSNVTFTWTPGTGPTLYDFWLSNNGVGTDDLYVSGHITTTSTTAPKVPAHGATIYARLWYLVDGTWHSTDYNYTEQ